MAKDTVVESLDPRHRPPFPSAGDIAQGERAFALFMDSPDGALARAWMLQTFDLCFQPGPAIGNDALWYQMGRRALALELMRKTTITTPPQETDDGR